MSDCLDMYLVVVNLYCYRCRGDRHVGRETTHQASTGSLQEGRCGGTSGVQHVTDGARQLRTRADPDPRSRREESGPHDERMESIRKYAIVIEWYFRLS